MNKIINLDQAASRDYHPELKNFIFSHLNQPQFNVSAKNPWANSYFEQIIEFKNKLLRSLGLEKSHDLIFTSSATEANNLLAYQYNEIEIIALNSDHPSLTMCANTLLSFKDLYISNDHLNKTLMISSAISATGTLINIEKLPNYKHIHIDATQNYEQLIKYDLQKIRIDSLTISAHKIGSIKGAAALIYNKNIQLKTMLKGGMQQYARSSTIDDLAILSWKFVLDHPSHTNYQDINIKFREIIHSVAPNSYFLHSYDESTPHILFTIIPGIQGDLLCRIMATKNIVLSTHSACSQNKNKSIPILSDLNIPSDHQQCAIRISFSDSITLEDIYYFKLALEESINEIQSL